MNEIALLYDLEAKIHGEIKKKLKRERITELVLEIKTRNDTPYDLKVNDAAICQRITIRNIFSYS